MRKNTPLYSYAFFVIIALLAGCTKIEKGPKGDTGAAGREPKVESEMITVLSTNWKKTADTLEWETEILLPKLTQSVVDNGSIQLFLLKDEHWAAVPYMEVDKFIIYSYEPGKVHLVYGSSHHIRPPLPTTSYYKVVLLSNP